MTPLRNSFTHKDLVKIAKHFGCFFSRQGRGSHEQRYSPKTDKDFTIPVHWSKPIKIWTLFSILEEAGISKQDVLDYLSKK